MRQVPQEEAEPQMDLLREGDQRDQHLDLEKVGFQTDSPIDGTYIGRLWCFQRRSSGAESHQRIQWFWALREVGVASKEQGKGSKEAVSEEFEALVSVKAST